MNTSEWYNWTNSSTESNSTVPPPSPNWHHIFFGTFYFFLALPSFTLHILVFISVLKTQGGWGQLQPFYVLVTNHYVADIMKTLFFLIYACPCIWAQKQVYGDTVASILGEVEGVDYSTVLLSTFLMSVNRAFAIGAPNLNEKIFTRRLCLIYNCLCWLVATLVSTINRFLSCTTILLEKKFIFSTICTHKPALSAGSLMVYTFAYGVVVFYLFALFSLAKQRKQIRFESVEINMRRHQLRLFWQALAIWMGVIGNAIAFRIIPLFTPGFGTVAATGVVIIGQSYITPVSMLVCVEDTRDGVKKLFGFNPNSVVPLSKGWTDNRRNIQRPQGEVGDVENPANRG